MQLHSQTSQFRDWLFTPSKLQEIREESSAKAASHCREMIYKEHLFKLKSENVDTADAENKAREFANSISYIDKDEQLDYVAYFVSKVHDFGKALALDKSIQGTAITYLKRFYLTHSIMDYDPKVMLITSIFLSLKTEHATDLSLDKLLQKVPNAPTRETVVEYESRLCQGLVFDFAVHQLSWSLHGLYLDIQAVLKNEGKNVQHLLADTYMVAMSISDLIQKSDLIFLYWSSQLALSAFMLASTPDFQKYLHLYMAQSLEKDDRWEALNERLNEIGEIVKALRQKDEKDKEKEAIQQTKERMQMLSRKLLGCRNPEFIAGSFLMKERERAALAERDEKRRLKSLSRSSSSSSLTDFSQ